MRGTIRSFSNFLPIKLFCSGVLSPMKKNILTVSWCLNKENGKRTSTLKNTHPVSSSRRWVLKFFKVCHRWLWKFFMCCASSRTRSKHVYKPINKCARVSYRWFADIHLIQKSRRKGLQYQRLRLKANESCTTSWYDVMTTWCQLDLVHPCRSSFLRFAEP